MADIFISYSLQDREKAEQLTELLASAGLSVWIDQQGIGAATSWSEEIVNALDVCKAFVVMLSSASVESKNVSRELALAFEKNKKILPLDLEPVQLPPSMQYHLAGLQRTSMTNIDSIIRALGKIGLEATQAPTIKLVKETDSRKSLMILPFEDLSPTADNEWFANGIVSELINALSNVKALKVMDAQTTKEFKAYKGHLAIYAKEMGVKYFVQGDVRKFGDQIKISSRLLDIETGDHLWQDSLRGEMKDIFEIQEQVATKVVEGLKVHLATDEKQKLAERGTESPEAFALWLKGREYAQRNTKEGFQLGAQLCSEAIEIDPGYALAYSSKALALAHLYRDYDRDPKKLEEALRLITEARRRKPDIWNLNHTLSVILMLQGKHEEAVRVAQEFIMGAPENPMSHFSLGFFYSQTGQYAKAVTSYEEVQKRKPNSLPALWNLVRACHGAGENTKQQHWAEIAIPIYEKHLKLFPDDEFERANHAALLYYAGRNEETKAAAEKLGELRDAASLINTACLFSMLKEYELGLRTFIKSIHAGYRNLRLLKDFLEDDTEGVGSLRGTPEYEEAKRMVRKIEQEEVEKKNG